jgi:hypothetical protein
VNGSLCCLERDKFAEHQRIVKARSVDIWHDSTHVFASVLSTWHPRGSPAKLLDIVPVGVQEISSPAMMTAAPARGGKHKLLGLNKIWGSYTCFLQ